MSASASDTGDAAFFNRHGRKVLFLDADAIRALDIARLEAKKHNIQLDRISRYMLVFDEDTIQVSLAPPYEGGLDGPEFRVVIRRSNFDVLNVENKLEAE
jgi:hypothetical protein